ncbi:hypothetical protein AGMMS49995_10880 [Endomicrobiia bacterium]|nr:hypothetical protein AGMMS49995_10880 [Endomicrobiia bacterium]
MALMDRISYGVGINLKDPDDEQKFNLGTKAFGPNGEIYVYGKCIDLLKKNNKAGFEFDEPYCFSIAYDDDDLFEQLVTVIYDNKIDTGEDLGFPPYAMIDGMYGWFLVLAGKFESPI